MTAPFAARMAELDAVVGRCAGRGVFATAIVRDTSNRSVRDWPWWGVALERTDRGGSTTRRVSAEVRLAQPAPGEGERFEGLWSARGWQGVATDSFTASGSVALHWTTPSPQDLNDALAVLLQMAEDAIRDAPRST